MEAPKDIQKPALPASAQAIADVIGYNETVALAAVVKHRHLYLSPKPESESFKFVAGVIGEAKTKKLAFVYGGFWIPFPTLYNLRQYERDQRIRAMHKAKRTPKEIAEAVNITYRHVKKILGMGKSWKPSYKQRGVSQAQ